ncbi:unnamed protein product [Ceratitis capitata]|uniref:(Mediterranean fruit fly) hypothetical protein n=1 Tax=Ceratitis capitata TaxID=7213 RepID=A0A811V4V8_CERCA|nr:unnamed protein product [Ceratitis capitata]
MERKLTMLYLLADNSNNNNYRTKPRLESEKVHSHLPCTPVISPIVPHCNKARMFLQNEEFVEAQSVYIVEDFVKHGMVAAKGSICMITADAC